MKFVIILTLIILLLIAFYKFLNIQVLRKRWWKVVGIFLFLSCLISGLMVPLGAGIRSIENTRAVSGSIYSTKLELNKIDKSDYSVYLRRDSSVLIKANSVRKDSNFLFVEFNMPVIGGKNFLADIVVSNSIEGLFGTPSIVSVQADPQLGFEEVIDPVGIEQNTEQYFAFPFRRILYESIRNIFYHVPLWFAMTLLTLLSAIFAVKQLKTGSIEHDIMSAGFAHAAIAFGLLGFATGSLWGNFTWGSISSWLLTDIKIIGAMLGVLMYFAYFILRNSLQEESKRARVAAVYNIIAFVMYIVFIYVLPRQANASLHPGNANNPAFSSYDLDGNMRIVFYPAVIAYMIIGVWFSSLWIRIQYIRHKQSEGILKK